MGNLTKENSLNAVLVLLLIAVPFVATALDEPFYITLATRVVIFAIAGVGLNLALGLGGLVSFGHAAFFGLGGYVTGILASHALNYEPIMTAPFEINGTTEMLIIWPIAILVSGLAALAIGFFSLRTTGVYFIMITLAFAQMIYYFAISWPAYGGEDGLSVYVRSKFPGVNTLDPTSFFFITLGILMLTILVFFVLKNSRFGAALQAARQNDQRLSSVGITPFNIRLMAFVISAMITGLAGALYTDLNRFVSPSVLSWHASGEMLIFVILGGVGRLFGPVVGAALFILFEFAFGGLTEHWMLFLGLVLLVVVLFARGGLIGFVAGKVRHG